MVLLEPGSELVTLPEIVCATPGGGQLVAAESRHAAAQFVVEQDKAEVVGETFVECAGFD